MQKCENRCSNAAILFLWKRGEEICFLVVFVEKWGEVV